MDVLDGNAIGGALFDVFGHEMTSTLCTCAGCGHNQAIAQTKVYLGGPGIVVRCASCENVLIVVVERRGIACVDLMGISAMAAPPHP
jgi:Family of unknown function (DUF6510)